jgi:uncharacterized protein (DUF342 family)
LISFAGLQAAVKERLELDSAIVSVETEGDTLEAAVTEAALALGVSLRHIEYEILEKQSSFLGIGRDVCKIRAYKRKGSFVADEEPLEENKIFDEYDVAELMLEDTDGDVFVQCRRDGVYIKVTEPLGEGEPVSKSAAMHALRKRGISSFDMKLVENLINYPKNDYTRIGDFNNIILNDTTVDVEITDQETKAFLKVNAPKTGGCDFTYEEYLQILRNHGVTSGIKEDFLKTFADRPIYKEKVCVATAKKPVDGLNSYVEYFFETDPNRVQLSETVDGKVNFKELNIIQNVFKDEKLAILYPAEKGEAGFTVTGKILPAHDGKEIQFAPGKNVHFAADNVTILADINGQVVISNGKINVESVYIVEGGVNLKTGNILFLGNVIVCGNVEEGFSVKASGNIEVQGMVDKATLTAEGNIVVRQGIAGKKGESITAGRSVWARFIENAAVSAGSMVVVSDGILNSFIEAESRIICQGKRAAIIGGLLRATEEISAKSIGSPSVNTETVCEVGIDPKKKKLLDSLVEKKTVLMADLDTVTLNIKTLMGIKQQRQSLPEDKEKYLEELTEERANLAEELKTISNEIEEITQFLQNISVNGRVSASSKIYPGAVINIRDAKYRVNNDFKASTFILENGIIRAISYVETDADIQQKKAEK